jgi:hypothetical protein
LKYFYWEIVIMFRKIALILIQSFLVQYGVLLQALVVFVLLIIFVVLTMTQSPFQTVVLNHLEVMSLMASMITVYCGIFFLVEVSQTDIDTGNTSAVSGIKLDEGTKVFFFLVILLSNLCFLLYWALMMYLEVRSMLIKKFASLYILLCLCGNQGKHEKLAAEIAIRQENEVLREKYLELLRGLEGLHSEGRIVLNQRNIEKVAMYLEGGKVMKAAGIDPDKVPVKEREMREKRVKRMFNPLRRAVKKQIDNEGLDEMEEHPDYSDPNISKLPGSQHILV